MVMSVMSAQDRIAPIGEHTASGAVTLMNQFAVPAGRDEAFFELWRSTSEYFVTQPGFISLRLYRAVSSGVPYRWVNVANWDSEAHFRAAHATETFRGVVSAPGWKEFASSPVLFESVTAVG